MTVITTVLVNGKIPVRKTNEAICRGCGKSIGWGETDAGKKMPFDLDEKNTSHWATCTKAKDLRRGKK